MNSIHTLMKSEERLWQFKMSRAKGAYLSIKEIQDIMRNGKTMPTAIFSDKKEII